VLDRSLRIVEIDGELAALAGAPAARLLGLGVAEALPAWAERLEPALGSALESGQPVTGLALGGEGAPLATLIPVAAGSGFVLGVELLVDAGAPGGGWALTAAELGPIFTQAPIGVIVADLGGRLIEVNPRFCALTGYTREELLTLDPGALNDPDDADEDRRLTRLVLAGELPAAVITKRYVRQDGQAIWVRVTRSLVRDGAGAPRAALAFVEDISSEQQIMERMRSTTAAMMRSEAKFAAAFKAGPIILTISRLRDGRFVDVNDSFVASTGYSREEALGRTPIELGLWVEPSHRDAGMALIRDGKPVRDSEGRFRMRDGTVIIGLVSADLIEVDGEPCVLSALMDITARKRAEAEQARLAEALAQERALLEEVLRQLPVGVIIAGADGRLLLGNAQTERIWRRPFIVAEDVEGYKVYEGFHADGRPYDPQEWPLARAISAGEVVEREQITIRRGDGTHGVIEVSAAPLRDAGGAIRGGVVTFHDVTPQARAARSLQLLATASDMLVASLEYDRTLATVARLAVPELADWCLVHLLEADGTARLVGLEQADPANADLVPAMQHWYTLAPDAPSHIALVLRSGRPLLVADLTDADLQRVAQGDEHLAALRRIRPRSAVTVPLLIGGACVGALSLVMAVSERRYDEEDLALAQELARRAAQAILHARLFADEQRARQEAEEAVRLRDEFISIASHELNTPLTTLLGTAQLMQRRDDREGTLAERDRRAVETVVAQARRLGRLVASLLDVTRLATGRLTLVLGPVELDGLLALLVEELRPGTRHELLLRLPTEPVALEADGLRLEQVFANLIQNAIKYSPAGTRVTVTLERQGAMVEVHVEDEGIGIPPEALPELFTRYYRAPNARSRRIAGIGIGLYVVREIVELHGGVVRVASEEGRGSRFTVALPAGPRS
jgi:PAS domain S-box-containing protein